MERLLALRGDTADAGRIRDVGMVLAGQPERVPLAGRGPAGVIAAYAALLVPEKVSEVGVVDPPIGSHPPGHPGSRNAKNPAGRAEHANP